MIAETLRRAATLMRERAEAATPGPWEARPPHGWDEWEDHLVYAGAVQVIPGGGMHGDDGPSQSDAAHIASWHPAVALAVAKLLDDQAKFIEEHGAFFDIEEMGDANALAVARAYLGEASC